MKSPVRYLLIGAASVALLAGCNDSEDSDSDALSDDPAVSGALDDAIMVDPELAGQDQGGSAASAGGTAVELPPEQRGPEAIAAARQDAARIAGGTVRSAPSPSQGKVAPLVEDAATAAQIAASSKAANTDCSSKVEYSMNWTSKLPSEFGVYPRGAVQEAAGTDSAECSLRVVSFVTPVDPGDVVDFYYTRASNAGYGAEYHLDGKDHVLGGRKSGKSYLVFARTLDNGLTEVDLVTSGR